MQRLGLVDATNRSVVLFKRYLPYSESDHVLNIAYNLLAGGTCLEHLELRRNDEVYLNALGAQRIPDPTTAGDFCRRFGTLQVVNFRTPDIPLCLCERFMGLNGQLKAEAGTWKLGTQGVELSAQRFNCFGAVRR